MQTILIPEVRGSKRGKKIRQCGMAFKLLFTISNDYLKIAQRVAKSQMATTRVKNPSCVRGRRKIVKIVCQNFCQDQLILSKKSSFYSSTIVSVTSSFFHLSSNMPTDFSSNNKKIHFSHSLSLFLSLKMGHSRPLFLYFSSFQ